MEHTPISALPVEAVICCCNHTAHPARLRNATVINFLPINENFELLLPNLLVGAHMQLEVFPGRLWEQSWPTKTGSNGMRVHHAAGLTQRCASHPSCSSSGLTWQHPAGSAQPAGANAACRGTCGPSAPGTVPGISGGAAPSREASPAPGPRLSTVKQRLRTKQTSCKYLKYVEARRGGATADPERGGDETRAGKN